VQYLRINVDNCSDNNTNALNTQVTIYLILFSSDLEITVCGFKQIVIERTNRKEAFDINRKSKTNHFLITGFTLMQYPLTYPGSTYNQTCLQKLLASPVALDEGLISWSDYNSINLQ